MMAQIGEQMYFVLKMADYHKNRQAQVSSAPHYLGVHGRREMAWARQPDDRQWNGPEGDDPRTCIRC